MVYHDDSYGCVSYDDDSSGYVCYDDDDYGYVSNDDDNSSYGFNLTYDTDDSDDEELLSYQIIPETFEHTPHTTKSHVNHHSVQLSDSTTSYVKELNVITNSDKTPSELAFENVVTKLFNQSMNGSMASFFINCYGRKDIVDMMKPELCKYTSTLYSQLKKYIPKQSERDLLSILFLCKRYFVNM